MRVRRNGTRIALAGAIGIAIAMSGATGAVASDPGDSFADDPNLVRNPSFTTDYDGWSAYGVSGGVENGQFCGGYFGPHIHDYDAGFGFNNIVLPAGDYFASFDASSELGYTALVQETNGDWTLLGKLAVTPSDQLEHHEFTFSSDTPFRRGEYHMHFGTPEAGPHNFCIDNAFLAVHPKDYAKGGDFDGSLGAWKVKGADAEVTDAGVCLAVPEGTSAPEDVSLQLRGIALPAFAYTVNVDASGAGAPVRTLVTSSADPSVVYGDSTETASADPDTYTSGFDLGETDDKVDLNIQLGGGAGGDVCLDNVQLLSGGKPPAYEPETGPRVRVNQLGYEASGVKHATLVTDATDPVAWTLKDGSGVTVAEGMSTPFGTDVSSRLNVQEIDFSDVTTEGTYTLTADDDESYPFSIAADLYGQLRYDSLNYFYLARSGIEIDPAIVGDEYARVAGHVSQAGGSDVNQGDYGVACQPAGDSQGVYGEPWTCDYTLDVVGGWYDAGDQGKYVVNGGISVYQLMSEYERIQRASEADRDALGDSVLNLPETDNGVPDILDEARWELDFMKSMMVPEGDQYAGMVHHKVHDFSWTSLPLMPADDPNVRYLHRPSTAATLNFAATAAQGARLFKKYDGDYASSLLDAAKTAWKAALAHPDLYAPVSDGAAGGGPYDDDNVTDEFYWAAAELYLTTGDKEYEDYLLASPLHTADVFSPAGFGWADTAALGRLDLATVPNKLPDHDSVVASVVDGADTILAVQAQQGFGQALGATDFVWGSNSQVLNNQVVLATAYDLTGDAKYLTAVQDSMDYLLGRNALNQSYVTGYGTVFSQNQHSRWFAAELDPSLPHPPPGTVAGGPNAVTSSWDPTFATLYPEKDCAPQTCYLDDIQSWSTNEITINWNSALGWVSGFLAAPDAPVVAGGESNAGNIVIALIAVAILLGGVGWIVWRQFRPGQQAEAPARAKATPAASKKPKP